MTHFRGAVDTQRVASQPQGPNQWVSGVLHAELGRSRRVFESPILTDAVMVAVAYQLFLEAGLHSQRAASHHRLFFVVRLARPQVSRPPRGACVRTRDKGQGNGCRKCEMAAYWILRTICLTGPGRQVAAVGAVQPKAQPG